MRIIPTNSTSTGECIAGIGTNGQNLHQLNKPAVLVVDQNETYLDIADTENHRIDSFVEIRRMVQLFFRMLIDSSFHLFIIKY